MLILQCSLYFVVPSIFTVQAFCGDSIQWSHNLNIEDTYGMWYGVGYAQHTPDMTNLPREVGCVTLHITDITVESPDNEFDWSIQRRNYSDDKWHSYRNNPWSETTMSGSWLDIRIRRAVKRDIYNERKLRVVWDEDGQTVEQTYGYTPSDPGLWVAEQRELMNSGIDVWYPDEPPKHPQIIRILKGTPHLMIINHCSETGGGGVFSLILRRSPSRVERQEWYDYKRQFFNFDLPIVHRYTAICAGCQKIGSLKFVVIILAIFLFYGNISLY